MKYENINSSIYVEDTYLNMNNVEQNLISISTSISVWFKNTNFVKTNRLSNYFSNFFNKTGGCVELNNVLNISFDGVNFLENFSRKRAFGIIISDNFPISNNFEVVKFFFFLKKMFIRLEFFNLIFSITHWCIKILLKAEDPFILIRKLNFF